MTAVSNGAQAMTNSALATVVSEIAKMKKMKVAASSAPLSTIDQPAWRRSSRTLARRHSRIGSMASVMKAERQKVISHGPTSTPRTTSPAVLQHKAPAAIMATPVR